MPRDVYFWQSGSLPGIGAFSGGQVISVSDDGRAVLSSTPLALPPAPFPLDSPAMPTLSNTSQPSPTAEAAPERVALPSQSSSPSQTADLASPAMHFYANGG